MRDDGLDVTERRLGAGRPVRGYHKSMKVDEDLLWVSLVEKKENVRYICFTQTHTHAGFFSQT